jgi:hypothetical protein
MFQVFQSFQRYVVVVSYGYCKSRSGDVAYIASVSEACCKRLFKTFHLFLDVRCNHFYLDIAYVFTHMLKQYVLNVSAISVLCCSKCFFMLQLFYLDVAYVSHMLQVYVPNVSFISNICYI